MPMLDEEEFALVAELYGEGIRASKEFCEQYGLAQEALTREERFRPCLNAYERLTGYRMTNPNAVMHHRLALYGPPCAACGKPLRTPRASRCVACGAARAGQ